VRTFLRRYLAKLGELFQGVILPADHAAFIFAAQPLTLRKVVIADHQAQPLGWTMAAVALLSRGNAGYA